MTVSFIVPVYNAESYIENCLLSLIGQPVMRQIIVVDDGCTDRSMSIVRKMASKLPDSGIEIYEQIHAGQAAARNIGLEHATGDYIVFVDADDSLAYDWCERHLQTLGQADYIQSGYTRIENGKHIEERSPLHRYQFTTVWGRLYRRQAVEHLRFREGYIYEDVLFSLDLWLSGAKGTILRSYCGYYYTRNPQSTTAHPNMQDRQRLFEELRQRAQKESLKGKIIIYYTYLRLKLHFLHV